MLVISVTSGTSDPEIPIVEDSQPELPLQECLNLILASTKPWGIYLRVKSRSQLAPTLQLLQEAYDSNLLHHPVWINMDISHGAFSVHGYITGQEFLRTIDQIFPYLTMAPSWPREALDRGYTPRMVDDMMELFHGVWQDVSLQLLAEHLEKSEAGFRKLLQSQPRFSLNVENKPGTDGFGTVGLKFVHKGDRERTFYNAK